MGISKGIFGAYNINVLGKAGCKTIGEMTKRFRGTTVELQEKVNVCMSIKIDGQRYVKEQDITEIRYTGWRAPRGR